MYDSNVYNAVRSNGAIRAYTHILEWEQMCVGGQEATVEVELWNNASYVEETFSTICQLN